MATEQYSNLASTSLTAAYTAGDGTATVANTGNAFPANPNFRIGIYDALTGVEKVLLKVTSIISSTKFAVTAEGTDANGANGDTVVGVLTKAAIDAIRVDEHQFGAYASLPGTASQSQGNVYQCTDAPFQFIYTGSIWQAYYVGRQVTPISTASWTAYGTGGTVTNGSGWINVVGTFSSTAMYGIYTPQASSTFTNTFVLYPAIPSGSATGQIATVSISFFDGTKSEGIGISWNGAGAPLAYPYLETIQTTNTTTNLSYLGANGQVQGGNQASVNALFNACPLWVQLARTGTSLSGAISIDQGITFTTAFTDTTPFLTPTRVCVYTDPRGSPNRPQFTLISYQ